MKFVFLLVMFFASTLGAQTLTEKFDSKGHPKAKGVWMSVRYPAGWKAQEGERPNIVQKFVGRYEALPALLMLQINSLDADIESECKSTSANDWAQNFSDEANGFKASNARKTIHETKPAFLVNMSSETERAGGTIFGVNRVMYICHKKNLVMAWCGTFGVGKITSVQSKKYLETLDPLCFQYFNSVVLLDQYR